MGAAVRPYIVSPDCLKLTEAWEGCVPRWYQDVVRVWTGGYGHTCPDPSIRALYPAPFTQRLMDSWLVSDMEKCVRAINVLGIDADILGQHRADALADACFNCGTGLLAPSNTITRLLLARNWSGAADALLEWCHVRLDGKVFVNPGLLNRRKAERALFLTPNAQHLYKPDTTGYEVCGSDAICNPDEIREIINEGAAMWIGNQPDYGARDDDRPTDPDELAPKHEPDPAA